MVHYLSSTAALPLVDDLGAGETEVLALALELSDAIVIIDDAHARRISKSLGIRLTGTLGVLLDAKRHGLIPEVGCLLSQLDALGFRLSRHTRHAVLQLAEE